MYDNSLVHHLGHDRPSISPPSPARHAQKCSHGHMYPVLDTFRRAKSPTRLSGGWRRLVRQLSGTPPRARSTDNLHLIRPKMFPRTHVPRARHPPPGEIVNSAKFWYTTWGTIDRQSPLHTHENVPTDTYHGLDALRPTISTSYARKCSHGHMYPVLDTFRRAKSPTRLSGGWRQVVRQLSGTPPRARSTDNLHFIRTKMFPRTHVPRARCLPPGEIANSVEWRLEATRTTSDCYVGDISTKPSLDEIRTPCDFVALIG